MASKPGCVFRTFLEGVTLRSPDQVEIFNAIGNQACVPHFGVVEGPGLVLFGLNRPLLDELKKTGSIDPKKVLRAGS